MLFVDPKVVHNSGRSVEKTINLQTKLVVYRYLKQSRIVHLISSPRRAVIGDSHLHLESPVGCKNFDVRIATNQCQSRLLRQSVGYGIVVEVDEVAANVFEIVGDVELCANALPVRLQSVVVSQVGDELMGDQSIRTSDEIFEHPFMYRKKQAVLEDLDREGSQDDVELTFHRHQDRSDQKQEAHKQESPSREAGEPAKGRGRRSSSIPPWWEWKMFVRSMIEERS